VNVSLKATPLSIVAELMFLRVKVSVVVPPSWMLEPPNAFPIVGGATTVTVSLHVLLLSSLSVTSLLGLTLQTPPVGLA
jgi:hypothetical protein